MINKMIYLMYLVLFFQNAAVLHDPKNFPVLYTIHGSNHASAIRSHLF
jgi:hypothetical protein